MNNDRKNRIITISIIVSFSVTLFICIFIVPIVIGFVHENRIKKEIHNSLINFEHSSKTVYYDDTYIYYNGEHTRFDDDTRVYYVDDDNIIKYNYRKNVFILERGTECIVLKEKNTSGYYDFFVRGYYVFFTYLEKSFYMYDIENSSFMEIPKEDYYYKKYGKKYYISLEKNSIKCINNATGKEINISTGTLTKENTFSSIANFNIFNIKDYQIYNDDLYIRLYYLDYEIIVKYDFLNNYYEMFDWFDGGYDIDEFNILVNKYPVSLERYFMVNAYE